MTLVSYILGFCNLLSLCTYIITLSSVIAVVYTITKLVKKEEKIENLITLPTVIYILVIGLIYYIVRDIRFGADYDEYMFWGTNLKVMIKESCLWAYSQVDGIHLVYPPFTAVTQYIFCKYNGGFHEGITYFALVSLVFSALMPLLKKEKYNIKSLLKILLVIISTYVAIVLFRYNIANLSVDYVLGIMFGVAMYLGGSVKEKRDYITLIILLISITLTKTNGILFAGIVIMQLFFKELFYIIKNQEKEAKKITRRFLIIVILLLTVICTYLSWKIYYTINGKQIDERHDKNNVQNIDIKEFIYAILQNENSQERNRNIVEKYFSATINYKITEKNNINTTVSVFIIINIASIIYLMINKKKLNISANVISINIGFIIYMLTNLLMFMFVFQEYQGEVIMGFERYTQTYLLAMTINLIYIILQETDGKSLIAGFIVLCIMKNGLYNEQMDPRRTPRDIIKERTIENASFINENVKPDEKVYIIDQKLDGGIEFMQTRYLISPIKTNLLYEWNIGRSSEGIYYRTEFTEQELLEKLVNEEYDYIYIIGINKSFLEEYKNLFTDETKKKLREVILLGNVIESNGILISVHDILENIK